MFNASLSSEIFKQLMNGKIINKSVLNNSGQFTENPLFNEIMNNLNDYRVQYEMCGMDLVEETEYIYIRDIVNSAEDLKTDITMRACLLLLLIGKYLTDNNYKLSKITDPTGGITAADIEAIQETSDAQEIIQKANLKNDLHLEIRNVLVNRYILLEKPSSQTYILSNSGKAFFNELIQNYKYRDDLVCL